MFAKSQTEAEEFKAPDAKKGEQTFFNQHCSTAKQPSKFGFKTAAE